MGFSSFIEKHDSSWLCSCVASFYPYWILIYHQQEKGSCDVVGLIGHHESTPISSSYSSFGMNSGWMQCQEFLQKDKKHTNLNKLE